MAISRVKVWNALEVLAASDLNGEINNILNNALSLISPLTGNLDFGNNKALNMRLEVQSATQSASQQGRVYYQSSEGSIHLDTGSAIARVPALVGLQQGDFVVAGNPTGVSGATQYVRGAFGTGLTFNSTTGVLTASGSSSSGGNPIAAAVFN